MSRQSFKSFARLVTCATVAGVVTVCAIRYTNPDLRSRSTAELRWEAITLGRDNTGKPLLLSALPFARQERIVEELVRRNVAEVMTLDDTDETEPLATADASLHAASDKVTSYGDAP